MAIAATVVPMSQDRKQWKDLSPRQRAAVVAGGAIQVTLQAAALVDLYRRPTQRVNGRKPVWVALSFINFVGPVAYFAYGRK
jgi:hypothetical protein